MDRKDFIRKGPLGTGIWMTTGSFAPMRKKTLMYSRRQRRLALIISPVRKP